MSSRRLVFCLPVPTRLEKISPPPLSRIPRLKKKKMRNCNFENRFGDTLIRNAFIEMIFRLEFIWKYKRFWGCLITLIKMNFPFFFFGNFSALNEMTLDLNFFFFVFHRLHRSRWKWNLLFICFSAWFIQCDAIRTIYIVHGLQIDFLYLKKGTMNGFHLLTY